jgi:hypothetical protein
MSTGGASLRGDVDVRDARASELGQRPHFFADIVRGRENFLKLKKEWDAALAAGLDPSPTLEHDQLRLWLENFAPSATPLALVARRESRIAGALGLTLSAGVVDGVPVKLAQGWTNAHSTRGGLLSGQDGAGAVEPLTKLALGEPWDVLTLRDLPRDGTLEAFAQALREAGCAVSYDSPMDSPYVPLPPTWEELEKRLDARFRQNLRRRRRRLEEHGPVRFEIVTGGDALDLALEDALAIEASGWKGQQGSAIRARPEQVGFYAGWARHLAQKKRLRLCFLTLGERRIAFHFAFEFGGRYYLPKCGFDETYAECSPGQLLMAEVLKHCIAQKLETFEFLGFSMPWKRDWTPLVRPHATLWAYRPNWRGRLAQLVHTEVRPRVAAAVRDAQAAVARYRGGK